MRNIGVLVNREMNYSISPSPQLTLPQRNLRYLYMLFAQVYHFVFKCYKGSINITFIAVKECNPGRLW